MYPRNCIAFSFQELLGSIVNLGHWYWPLSKVTFVNIVIMNSHINPLGCFSEFDGVFLGASISGSGSGYPDGSTCQEDGILSLFQRWVWILQLFLQIPILKTDFWSAWQGHSNPERMPSVCLFIYLFILQHTENCRNAVRFSWISLALKLCVFKKVCAGFMETL